MRLAAIDEALLDDLVALARDDASAADVTPPLTPGDDWTPARRDWLRAYHRACRDGLRAGHGEESWAILAPVPPDAAWAPRGAVRLKRLDAQTAETGLWLARHARGHDLAEPAIRAVAQLAVAHGVEILQADTACDNLAALAVLSRLGFALRDDDSARVSARLRLPRPEGPPTGGTDIRDGEGPETPGSGPRPRPTSPRQLDDRYVPRPH